MTGLPPPSASVGDASTSRSGSTDTVANASAAPAGADPDAARTPEPRDLDRAPWRADVRLGLKTSPARWSPGQNRSAHQAVPGIGRGRRSRRHPAAGRRTRRPRRRRARRRSVARRSAGTRPGSGSVGERLVVGRQVGAGEQPVRAGRGRRPSSRRTARRLRRRPGTQRGEGVVAGVVGRGPAPAGERRSRRGASDPALADDRRRPASACQISRSASGTGSPRRRSTAPCSRTAPGGARRHQLAAAGVGQRVAEERPDRLAGRGRRGPLMTARSSCSIGVRWLPVSTMSQR